MVERGELLKDLKSEVKSLLVSSPTNVRLQQFLKDFKAHIGYNFPFKELGFPSAVALLYQLSDVVQVQNFHEEEILVPVGIEKTSHISELVANQKSSILNSRKGKGIARSSLDSRYSLNKRRPQFNSRPRYSLPPDIDFSFDDPPEENGLKGDFSYIGNPVPPEEILFSEPLVSTPHSQQNGNSEDHHDIPPGLQRNLESLLLYHPDGILTSKLQSLYQATFNCPLLLHELGFSSVKEMAVSLKNIFSYEEISKTEWVLFKPGAKITKKCVSKRDPDKKWIPYEVLDNLTALTHKYPSGISSSGILDLYEKAYNKRLDIKNLGFDSIVSFLVNCPNIHLQLINDVYNVLPKEWKQFVKPAEAPCNPLPPIAELSFLWEQYFGEDFCNPLFKYIPFKLVLPSMDEQKLLPVTLADFVSPISLFVQPLYNKDPLKKLMNDLMLYYDTVGENQIMNPTVINVDQGCAVKFNGVWHRAKIVSKSGEKVQVCYVDYGTYELVDCKDIHYLHKKFGEAPVMGVQACLYQLKMPSGMGSFPHAAIQFMTACVEKMFYAEIITANLDLEEQSIDIILFDTSGEEDIDINAELVARGYASISGVDVDTQTDSSMTGFDSGYCPTPDDFRSGNSFDKAVCCTNGRLPTDCCSRKVIRQGSLNAYSTSKEIMQKAWCEVLEEEFMNLVQKTNCRFEKMAGVKIFFPELDPDLCQCLKENSLLPLQSMFESLLEASMVSFTKQKNSEDKRKGIQKHVSSFSQNPSHYIPPSIAISSPPNPSPPPCNASTPLDHSVVKEDIIEQPLPPVQEGIDQCSDQEGKPQEEKFTATAKIFNQTVVLLFPDGIKGEIYVSVPAITKAFTATTTSVIDHRLEAKNKPAPYRELTASMFPLLFKELRRERSELIVNSKDTIRALPLSFVKEYLTAGGSLMSSAPSSFENMSIYLKENPEKLLQNLT